MGTSTSKTRLNQSLSFKHDLFKINDLDQITEKGFELIKSTEVFRCQFTPLWNRFINLSGGIVLQSPHFHSAIDCLLMKLSCDLNGKIYNSILIHQNHPFVTFQCNQSDLSSDSHLIIDAFTSVCIFSKEHIMKIKELESSYQAFIKEIDYLQKDHEKYFSARGVPPGNIFANSRKLSKYIKKFKHGYKTCNQMRHYLEAVNHCLMDYEDYCKKENVMAKYEHIGEDAWKKKISKPQKIVFKYSTEKKVINFEDYYDRVNDYEKIKKNCKQLLELYNSGSNYEVQKGNIHKKMINDNKAKEIDQQNKGFKKSNTYEESNLRKNVFRKCKSQDQPDENKEHKKTKEETDIKISNDKQNKIEEKRSNSNIKSKSNQSNFINQFKDISDEDSSKSNKKSKTMTHEINSNGNGNHNEINLQSMHYPISSLETLHFNSTIRIYPEDKDYPTAFAYIKEHNLLITGMSNGTLIFTNIITATEEKVLLSHCKKITSIISINDGQSIITGSKDGIIYKHDLDYYESTIIGTEDSIDSMINLSQGISFLVASNKAIIAYDLMEMTKLYSFIAHEDQIKDMIYYDAKEMLVTSSKDKKIKIWNTTTQECIGVLKGITNTINSLCFAQKKDNLMIVSASRDGFVTFWNLSNKKLTKTFKMKTRAVKVMYLENEQNVISINDNGTITIFNIDSNDIKEMNSNQPDIKYNTAIYFEDGKTIAIGTNNALVQLWSTS